MGRGWVATLDVKDLWADEDNSDEAIKRKAEAVADRLKALHVPGLDESDSDERDDIAEEFGYVENVSEFDDVLYSLYNWADAVRVWVATF